MQGFEKFDRNPFESIISGMGRGGAPQQPQGQPMPQGPHQMPGGQMMQGQGMMDEDNQLMKGKGGGTTPFLMGAVQSLQKYITASTDPAEVAAARSIVLLITKLITKDQQRQAERIPQDQEMLQGPAQQPPQAPQQ